MESLWNKRRVRFEALRLALTAEETWGPLSASGRSVDSSDWLRRRIAEAPDEAAKASIEQQHRSNLDRNDKELARHMQQVWEPLCEAGLALVRTPAPDLEALRFKQGVLSDCLDLTGLEDEDGELFALFMADVARLAGEAVE